MEAWRGVQQSCYHGIKNLVVVKVEVPSKNGEGQCNDVKVCIPPKNDRNIIINLITILTIVEEQIDDGERRRIIMYYKR